jgi:hypothetical protein
MMKRSNRLSLWGTVLLACALPAPAWAMQAQPVPVPEGQSTSPQLDVAGVTVGTLGYGATTGGAGINLSDSDLFVGAAQRMVLNNGIGSMGFGVLTTDAVNRGLGGSLFLNQAFADYQTESFEALVGRTDNRVAHLVDFPTLRGDDLITLTNPLDPLSNGQNVEEHRYANVAAVTLNQNTTWFEELHAQHLIDSAGNATDAGINSFGANLEYLAPPGMEAFQRVPSWGVGAEYLPAYDRSPTGLGQLYAGGVLNLNQSVVHRWDLRAQDIVSVGSGLTAFQNVTDTYQANSNALAASLRYLYSPFGTPGYQLALTGGYKDYFQVPGARSLGLALTGAKRLGQGFDLVAQYQGQWRDTTLAAAQTSGLPYEQTVEVGLVYNFDATFNQHLSPRRSLLNQQHRYIPE